ncbi:MAG: winged helix-turn-helix domain-containing protein [Duncaniella sp.]|nr:winged helix-turn-helix domain-containing protein [Duncaniella sp.]MDE6465676.1 winged helix-turn-helix domain-containing protein [Duncaniella sp.]MDE6573418.1 winged helix-turn-helix domain-containing protein [Duncaniella sp.]
MNTDTIGQMAGNVWVALNEAEALDTKQLKKNAKLKNDRELYAALGWLAREGKVNFTAGNDSKEIIVSLVQSC